MFTADGGTPYRMKRRTILQIAFLAVAVLSARAQITLRSPQDWQIFQRETKTQGRLVVAGHLVGNADRVVVRVTGASTSGPLANEWHTIRLHKDSGDFTGSLRLPAGGFYSVEVRARRAAEDASTVTIAHVGIGEVFVISGQSNATNWGEQHQTPETGMVTAFDGNNWRPAEDPQPGTQDNSVKGSFLPPFGDALYRKYRVPIGIVSVGRGATSIRQWLPAGARADVLPPTSKFIVNDPRLGLVGDGTLFNVMVQRIRLLGPHGFRMMLWDQGQSDSSLPPEHTISGERFRQMTELVILTCRKQAGWKFPWMNAVGTYMSQQHPSDPAIQEAQQALWRSGETLEGPNTDLLTGANREKNGTGVHYSDAGLKAVAAAWAERVEHYIDTQR